MQLLLQQHAQEEEWGFLLIDVHNVFNEENHTAMLWTVRHDWRSGARFSLNCYFHWASLLIRAGNRTGQFLYRKEGVTQGDPLATVAYGLGNPPLIRDLRTTQPNITQP